MGQQQQEQQQYQMVASGRPVYELNDAHSQMLLNGCQNKKIYDYNNQPRQQLSLMDQTSQPQHAYRSQIEDDYNSGEDKEDDNNDDVFEEKFSSDGSGYHNNNVPQIIPNRPAGLFSIRKTLKPQQQNYIAFANSNGNMYERVDMRPMNQDNDDLDEEINKKLSETFNNEMSLIDTEFDIQPFDESNHNAPMGNDLYTYK
ncbi:GSCOCG00001929001-RA-CDS [Cotesia congregata]|nr:GSCOCG00001929001-RA-CDS [Cotesia congregata]